MGTRILTGMFFYLLCLQTAVPSVQVLSEEVPLKPYNILVDKWNLTWTPGTEDVEVTYTVEYRSFNNHTWLDVPECVHISSTSCDLTSTAKASHHCVTLRVLAEQYGLKSSPVQACSIRGDSCSPEFSMTSAPGSLTIHLSKNWNMEYAGHAKHRIYFGKEGEKLQKYKDASSSESFSHLDVGQRYCVKVEFLLYDKPYGTASCIQCEVIPVPNDSKRTVTIVAMVVVIVLLVLVPVMSYILIFQHKNIKKMLKPQYKIPEFLLVPFGESGPSSLLSSPSEELFAMVSIIAAKQTESSPPSHRCDGDKRSELLETLCSTPLHC